MTISQKATFSLLIAVLLFGGFSVLAFTGLFDLVQDRFYSPSVTVRLNSDITRNAESIDKFFAETQTSFSETLKTDTVRRSFLSHQNAESVSALSRVYNPLIDSFYGVLWIRFIDADGKRLFFSSYGPDILNGDETSPVYMDYNEPDFPYGVIAVPEDGSPKYTFVEKPESVIFSFPLYDSFDIYRGTALFSLSIDAVSERLVSEGRISHGEYITVITNPGGLLFGMPASGEAAILSQISSNWTKLALSSRIWPLAVQKTSLESRPSVPGSDRAPVLLSTVTSHGFFVGRLVNKEAFMFPAIMKIILLAAFFFTTYLTIFLLFNIRQDPLTIVQNRLKQLQISLIEQFYERKSEADWARWIRELEHRREEIRSLLKRGVKAGSGDKSADMDILINRSWDELLSVLGSRRNLTIPGETVIDEEKIAAILQKLLEARTGASARPLAPAPPTAQSSSNGKTDGFAGIAADVVAPYGTAKAGLLKKASLIASSIDKAIGDETEKIQAMGDIGVLEELDGAADMEIVSPFSTTVFDFSPANNAGSKKDGLLKENRDNDISLGNDLAEERGLPLITQPFFGMPNSAAIETLEAFNARKTKASTDNGNIIQEKEGIHYINEEVLAPAPESAATLNREFKDLVDSVTK